MVNIPQALLITDELDMVLVLSKECEAKGGIEGVFSLLSWKDRWMVVPLKEKDENREEAGWVRSKWGVIESLVLNILILISLRHSGGEDE